MMWKNKDKEIVILAFSIDLLLHQDVIFTDRNASTRDVNFFNNLKYLDNINWNLVRSSSWHDKPKIVKQVMMSEVLVPNRVSLSYLKGIYCKDNQTKQMLIQKYNISASKIETKPNLFFKY